MIAMAKLNHVAVFADCGDTSHLADYRQAGLVIGRHGAHLYCLARDGQWPRALVESALAAGGLVTVATGPTERPPSVPQGVTVITEASEALAARAIVAASQVIVGLPAGIETVSALYGAWSASGGAAGGRPVGLLNRNRAYEVVRGFTNDIAAVGRGNIDSLIQISDNFDDLWGRLTRLV